MCAKLNGGSSRPGLRCSGVAQECEDTHLPHTHPPPAPMCICIYIYVYICHPPAPTSFSAPATLPGVYVRARTSSTPGNHPGRKTSLSARPLAATGQVERRVRNRYIRISPRGVDREIRAAWPADPRVPLVGSRQPTGSRRNREIRPRSPPPLAPPFQRHFHPQVPTGAAAFSFRSIRRHGPSNDRRGARN